MLEKLEITGYRGFKEKGELSLAICNGQEGSGLTIITGANNSGKSTILECLKYISATQAPSFHSGVRNSENEVIEILYKTTSSTDDNPFPYKKINSLKRGSSETTITDEMGLISAYCVSSRRSFNAYFGKANMNKDDYIRHEITNMQSNGIRSQALHNFSARLFKINENPEYFNGLLKRALGFGQDWSIDLSPQNNYFLKFIKGNSSHSSEGLGEGIVSLFVILDALYDSKPGDIISFDEPELSLHPAIQKRLSILFREYSKDRQIIISTHSPYFIDLTAIKNGGKIVRVVSENETTKIFQLSAEAINTIIELAFGNINNPHTFGTDAKEIFFFEDNVILVEGQEDVVLFPKIASDLGLSLTGDFFGWGAGGADNVAKICQLLSELGFKRVAVVFDADKKHYIENLQIKFPNYYFTAIIADDIRYKKERKAQAEKQGLLDKDSKIIEDYKEPTSELIKSINIYLEGS